MKDFWALGSFHKALLIAGLVVFAFISIGLFGPIAFWVWGPLVLFLIVWFFVKVWAGEINLDDWA